MIGIPDTIIYGLFVLGFIILALSLHYAFILPHMEK